MYFGTDANNDNNFEPGAPTTYANVTIPCPNHFVLTVRGFLCKIISKDFNIPIIKINLIAIDVWAGQVRPIYYKIFYNYSN